MTIGVIVILPWVTIGVVSAVYFWIIRWSIIHLDPGGVLSTAAIWVCTCVVELMHGPVVWVAGATVGVAVVWRFTLLGREGQRIRA